MPRPLRSLANRLTLDLRAHRRDGDRDHLLLRRAGLEDQLVDQKLERLGERRRRASRPSLQGDHRLGGRPGARTASSAAGQRSNAEVTILASCDGSRRRSLAVADSNEGGRRSSTSREIAREPRSTAASRPPWTQSTDVGRQALAAQPLVRATARPRRRGVRRALSDVQANVELIRGRILAAGRARAHPRRGRRLPGGARAHRRASSGWRPPRARSRPATSPTRSTPTPTTSWASSRRRSTTCSASSRGSTPRASSSSRPRRTSCARRSSRSAASWSCSRTRSSTRRRAPSSSPSSAARSPHAQARHRAARPVAAGVGRARAAAGADRRRAARARGGERVHARRHARTTPSWRSTGRATRSRSTATPSASRR